MIKLLINKGITVINIAERLTKFLEADDDFRVERRLMRIPSDFAFFSVGSVTPQSLYETEDFLFVVTV